MALVTKTIMLITIAMMFKITTKAQHNTPDSVQAIYTEEKISFDGNLNEPVWKVTSPIENFTQKELDFGKPSTEKKQGLLWDMI